MSRKSEFDVSSCFAYFMEKIDSLGTDGYLPSNDDILRAHSKPKRGIVEEQYTVNGVHTAFYHVGAQRLTERKKWLHLFDDVTAVVFVASLADYSQESGPAERRSNRMCDACATFGEICDHPGFRNTHMSLFLNQKDRFQEDIHSVSLRNVQPFFDDYSSFMSNLGGSGDEVADSLQFVVKQFRKQQNEEHQQSFWYDRTTHHTMCALDSSEMKNVLDCASKDAQAQILQYYDIGVFRRSNSNHDETCILNLNSPPADLKRLFPDTCTTGGGGPRFDTGLNALCRASCRLLVKAVDAAHAQTVSDADFKLRLTLESCAHIIGKAAFSKLRKIFPGIVTEVIVRRCTSWGQVWSD